jgi:hypothetical protein
LTLYRDLARFEEPGRLGRLRAVSEGLVRQALAAQPWYTLDCDSTVETVYGEQEGARPGPNPHKRGRPSYHPLLCRERRSGLVIHSRLRPGDTGTATEAVEFLRQSVARLPRARHRTVLIRADRGFDAEALYAACEERGWHYLVKLRVTADLASRIWTQAVDGRWRRLDPDGPDAGEVSEFRFRRPCWRRARRVIVTRRRDAENPQGHLWDAAGYNYAAYVTDLPGPAADLVACYDKRADMEKAIHELKEDFGIDRISSSSFGANAADLELKILAFNLLVLYQRQALGWTILHRAKTLRRRLVAVAGQLTAEVPPQRAPRRRRRARAPHRGRFAVWTHRTALLTHPAPRRAPLVARLVFIGRWHPCEIEAHSLSSSARSWFAASVSPRRRRALDHLAAGGGGGGAAAAAGGGGGGGGGVGIHTQ